MVVWSATLIAQCQPSDLFSTQIIRQSVILFKKTALNVVSVKDQVYVQITQYICLNLFGLEHYVPSSATLFRRIQQPMSEAAAPTK